MDRVTEVIRVPTIMNVTGEIVARNVSYEDFLRGYDGQHVEWVDGVVIRMSPVTADHNALTRFLIVLFDNFLSVVGGQVFHDPMTMRLSDERRARVPDIQVLRPENLYRVERNGIEGPADLVVEVVSQESEHRDYVEKLHEYEIGGVGEYWIVDPLRRETRFYVLGPAGVYSEVRLDASDIYVSQVFPRLRLPADIFWRGELPRGLEIARLVEAMLGEE